MSLILKGIDIPKDAEYFSVTFYKKGTYRKEKIMDIDQAIQIPKDHGRLIDADELKEKRETMCWKDEHYMTHESDFIDSRHIDNAPTILESEEDDE